MAIYEITAPDGKTYEVEGSGTQEQALAHFKANYQTPQTPEVVAEPSKTVPFQLGNRTFEIPKINSPAVATLAGVPLMSGIGELTKGVGALTQLGFPETGGKLVKSGQGLVSKMKEIEPISATGGQIGSYLIPATALSSALRLGLGASLAGRVGAEAISGGAIGYGMTPGSQEERIKEGAINAGMGFGMPIVGGAINKAYQGTKAMLEPLYEQGQNAIIGKALRQFSGGQSDEAIKNLLASTPTVKGSLPTVGQASGVPSLAATERALQGASPEATNMLANRQTQNALARTNALENIATPSRIDKYTGLRKRLGDDLYEPALQRGMDFASLTPSMQQQIEGLIKSPAIKNAMEKAKTNALNRDIDIGNPSGSLRGLHETKMALDEQIMSLRSKLDKEGISPSKSAELRGLESAKDRLLGFIESPQISPEYKQARETFAKLSKPVNQLEEIAKLADKSTNAKDNTIYANRFFNELDKVKKDGLLSKQQIARLEAIGEDLKSKSFAENAGRGVGSNTMQNLAYANMANQVGIPNMLRNMPGGQIVGNVAKRAGNVLYGQANKDITNKMAETMLSPQRAAELMQMPATTSNLNTQQAQNLAKMLMLQQTTQGTQP
jgi:hypothetical protein